MEEAGIFGKWVIFAKGLLRLCFILVNNLYCIPTYIIWMFLLRPLVFINPTLYWKIEGRLFHFLLAMVSLWCDSAGYRILEAGDDISECLDDRTLIIANHQSTGDVPMLFSCYNVRKNVLPNVMWIMDSLFKYTNFGAVSCLHQDFFIKSGKQHREKALENLSKHLRDKYVPLNRKWLILFPEGGFLRKRKAISHKYAEQNNYPKFENVSLPRVGALNVIMNAVGPNSHTNNNCNSYGSNQTDLVPAQINYILDITIAYPRGVPIDLSHIVFGHRAPCETVFYYRLYRSSEVPEESEAMKDWLFKRWAEKEEMLQTYYDTGEMTTKFSRTKLYRPKLVLQDYLSFSEIEYKE
ncbi:hypothetical protein GWI33_020217 [Rhynchophorus ferrugineus]|uniref:Phospholipid/glycerol acyltransferase domain-containing protein n=1 Tax=Rhynchophorus ferrugineus TaxID=354439 RepID=A0A834HPV8_RHYFE|nr:hypothetical protein GWI33_020217 [Rhynchophorus ferrugineus]